MSKVKLNIWGRSFILPIYYECDSDEEVLPIQKEAAEEFVKNSKQLLKSDGKVIEYCLKDKANSDVKEITNIFKYVVPTSILSLRSKKDHMVALMCNYKFDLEHGLAVVFKNEKLVKVTSQDRI